MRSAVVLCSCALVGCGENRPAAMEYPPAERSSHVDVYQGVEVADPYRWMEMLEGPATQEWVRRQNALSEPFLRSIPEREAIATRLETLWNYERTTAPVERGGRYFYSHNDGLQDQSVIYVSERFEERGRVLLDPNALSGDATVAVVEFVPSPDGERLAYAVSDGGTDWKRWRIRDVATGEDLAEVLAGTKFTSASWSRDSSGFYYSRYPFGADGEPDGDQQVAVYDHRLGTPQAEDRPVYRIEDHPHRDPYAAVSDDGLYLMLTIFEGFSANGLYYLALEQPQAEVVRLFDGWNALYTYVGNRGAEFLVQTNLDAPNGRVIAVDVDRGDATAWREVVPETEDALEQAAHVGGRLVVHQLRDVRSRLRLYALDGGPVEEIDLPALGSVSDLQGRPEGSELYFSYTDLVTPGTLYRYDFATGRAVAMRRPEVPIEPGAFVTRQVFYESRDGTRVPMFIAHRADLKLDGARPTLLYGYGGFNSAQLPEYQPPRMVWLEMGGVLALANIRGGSEYGERWHAAGTKLDKQNVFDDFIAAAQWLIDNGLTSGEHLAIQGRSNGGLLVGAVMTQRPELFGAALPIVGVLDMLRYHTASANARSWASDYGLSEDEAEFPALYAYSPYHNVAPGRCYPPTLITTADRDDRVVPWHSYKFAAALQHAQTCDEPILIRIETRAGHKAGKPVWMQIEDFADQWAFLAEVLEMDVPSSLSRTARQVAAEGSERSR